MIWMVIKLPNDIDNDMDGDKLPNGSSYSGRRY